MQMAKPIVNVIASTVTAQTQGRTLAARIHEIASERIADAGAFYLAVPGGSVLDILATGDFYSSHEREYFAKWHVFFVDERCVPLDHADSNYGAFMQKLVKPAASLLKHAHVYPINDALLADGDAVADAIAHDYAACIGTCVPRANGTGQHQFDLLIMGIGPDGHTCSLFPESQSFLHSCRESSIVIGLDDSPKPPPKRVSMTLALLCQGLNIMFIATGAAKAGVIREILLEKNETYPPTHLSHGLPTTWWLDAAAASQLPPASPQYNYIQINDA